MRGTHGAVMAECSESNEADILGAGSPQKTVGVEQEWKTGEEEEGRMVGEVMKKEFYSSC